MIIARVYSGVAKHLPARATEWLLASILFAWGNILAWGDPIFDRPLFQALARIAGQNEWAIACLAIGGLRLMALTINGTFADTWWSRFSPHVRAGMAFMSCFFWTTISISIISVDDLGQVGTALAVYPLFLIFDLYNIVRSSSDARHSDEAFRDRATKS